MTKDAKHSLYEAMFILPANVTDDARSKLFEKIQQQMKENGGEIKKIFNMGKQKLAYLIGKHREGYYQLVYLTLPTGSLDEIKHAFNLNEEIIRYLFIKNNSIPEDLKFKAFIPNN